MLLLLLPLVQPTPDDLDLAVEYDLDEDDEEWLEQYNTEVRLVHFQPIAPACQP